MVAPNSQIAAAAGVLLLEVPGAAACIAEPCCTHQLILLWVEGAAAVRVQ